MSTSQSPEAAAPGTAVAIVEPAAELPVARVERNYGQENSLSAFQSQSSFDSAQRMAKALASSTMVPKDYQGSVANCLVAMELASRTGASVLAVMQNTHIINGRPSWSSTFLIASVNSCGRFSALRYETRGGEDPKAKTYEMRAYSTEKATGDTLHGEWISWPLVDGEGWSKKQGSKWLTMPGQMFRYRAAAFWTRSYAPEISLGMHSADELEDTVTPTVTQAAVQAATSGADKLRALVATPALEVASIVINDIPIVEPSAAMPAEPVELEAFPSEPESEPMPAPAEEAPRAEKAKESKDAYTQRMKTLQMRHKTGKALTKAEIDDLVKYEALHEV